jgi:hypothetical protein
METQPAARRRSVTFTGGWVLGAFFLGLIFTLSQPMFGMSMANSVLKHLPLLAFLVAFLPHAIGLAMADEGRIYSRGLIRSLWPFLLLGAYATVGSLYARYELQVADNYLNLGVYMLMMPLFFWWGRERSNGSAVVAPLMRVWGIAVAAAVVGSIAQKEAGQPLHESEFLVLSFFVYSFLAAPGAFGRVASIALLGLTTVLTGKITGYVIGLSAVFYVTAIQIHLSISRKRRNIVYAACTVGMAGAAALATVAYFHFREYLPSGNPDVRLHQYAHVYQKFIASPIWGEAYAGASGVAFRQGGEVMIIPSHSDVLDLLKAGGLLAGGLWLIGISRTLWLLAACRANCIRSRAYLLAMLFLTVATVFSYSFNPLLLKAPQAFVIWGMMAIALSVTTDRRPGQLHEA